MTRTVNYCHFPMRNWSLNAKPTVIISGREKEGIVFRFNTCADIGGPAVDFWTSGL